MKTAWILWWCLLFRWRSCSELPSTVPTYRSCTCVHISRCPALYGMLSRRPVTTSTIDALRNSTCGFHGIEPYVCCEDVHDRNRGAFRSRFDIVQNDVDTNDAMNRSEQCGLSMGGRVVGGSQVAAGTYPWMARLGYTDRRGGRVSWRCGGTLVSDADVVTAAHCVSDLPIGWRLTRIRLGELDERTDPDCDSDGECADRVQDVAPVTVVVHADYGAPRYKNDIALVKLEKPVAFTAFVRPICLPSEDDEEEERTGSVTVAGWGVVDSDIGTRSPVLMAARLRLLGSTPCGRFYETRFGMDVHAPEQLCTTAAGKDACAGDSGGPLMRVARDGARHVLHGVVSFGATRCGDGRIPAVFTAVAHYLPWLQKHL